MSGPGFGFGAAGRQRRYRALTSGGGSPGPAYSAAFTLTQFPRSDERRIYQRTTLSGGATGKGQGTIRVPISSAAGAGSVGARIRSEDGETILQGPWVAGEIDEGASFIDLSGVAARLGWFFVDLQGADGAWQLGTVKIGMGALYGFAGQSLMTRMFGRVVDSATFASLGVTADSNSSVCARYDESSGYMPTAATMPWSLPGDVADGAGPNSVGVGEFLNRMIALTGVNCGAIGFSQGGAGIDSFFAGQENWTRLSDTLMRAGGAFEGFVWGQGHSHSISGLPPAAYGVALTSLFDQLSTLNILADYGRYIWTIPSYNSGDWGTPWQVSRIRQSAQDWCAANDAAYVHMDDATLIDGVHEGQAGARTMARHMARAMRAQYGASSGVGPKPLNATRTGTIITLSLSDAGQSALSLVGTPGNRIFLFPQDRANGALSRSSENRFPVASVTAPNATTLSITLANDPGDGHALDLWLYWPCGPADAATDNIYDDRTDGDGVATGRIVQANFTPVQIAPPVPGGTVNAPPGGFVSGPSPFSMVETGTAYAASASGFGQQMTAGYARATNARTPTFLPVTVEGFFTCPALPSSSLIIMFGGFGLSNSRFIGINAAGRIQGGGGDAVSTSALVPGKRYHVAYQSGPAGQALYVTNVSDGGTGVREWHNAAVESIPSPSSGRFELRMFEGGYEMSGGGVDEWAVFYGERYFGTSYACPSVPLTGTEPNIVALYHCDGNAADAAAK